jgi:molecular chaperone DnaK
MSRTTIDFGIDLGTTNSAIAVLRGTVPDVIKNNLDNDITPSAVFIDKRGIQVGLRAKGKLEFENSAEDVYIEFKRRMGTDYKYEFKTAGRTMRPEEVSAEVLKTLRGDVQQRLGEDVQACVITVPAAFEQKQCAATRKAGELAGFTQCPLIMEPTAAALAYGFQVDVTKEYWLVYDFGGGTFDACLMKAEDGAVNIVNHGGDNYLGGSDIDWAVVEKLIVPHLASNYNLPDFSRGNKRWRTALAVIKRATEAAKIHLSRSDSAYLEDCRIKDADGSDIEVDFKLTRSALVDIAEPILMRSVDICKRVLKEKNLAPSAIEKVILVGGPTLAPYFREILRSNLGIELDHSVDPLTVVAKGAAVFAGTQRFDNKAAPKAALGQFDVDLRYKPVGAELDPTVRGEVKAPNGISVEGFSIEFANQKTHWRSGKVPLKAEGRFKINLLAEKGEQNVFGIELWGAKGGKQVIIPNTLTYTVGLAISEQPIINSIAIGLANNEADVFFKKGDPLPAKATRVYRSSATVKKGETGDVLKVPVVEGEIEHADRNRLLGTLDIRGNNLRRDVPAGSEIEVTLNIDASRIIRAKAYIPVLDEEIEAVIDYNMASPDTKRLRQELDGELKRQAALRDRAENADDDQANELLHEARDTNEIAGMLDAGKGDPDTANKAEKRLLEFKIHLDRAEDSLKWPALVTEVNTALDELDTLVEEHGNSDQREKAGQFREQAEELIEQKRSEPLRKKLRQVLDLHNEILFEQPGFWLGFFNYLVEDRAKIRDPNAADRLIDQGRQFINRGNVQGLRNVVAQLLGLLPREIAEAKQRGYHGDKGLLK